MATKTAPRSKPLALAYLRVSTARQADHGASLETQRAALVVEADRRGWDVEIVADEGLSAKNMKRPGLTSALDRLDAGEADYLMAIRLDRVSRSVVDFAGLMARSDRKGWGIVLITQNMDTSTPTGRLTANIVASTAQFERELISERVSENIARLKADGVTKDGRRVRFGRLPVLPEDIVSGIRADFAGGSSMNAIAKSLNERNVPTAHGGKAWYAATVKRIIESQRIMVDA
ncbi:recombinase family protein [Arthrobacter sp. 92]|uniref:recombinase family protein n=1 Tax=Arthrobacter sp. 92 TaxID=3418175 RepID=UPI003CFE9028